MKSRKRKRKALDYKKEHGKRKNKKKERITKKRENEEPEEDKVSEVKE